MAISVQDWKNALNECEKSPETNHAKTLQTALHQRSNLVVGRAAAVVMRLQVTACIPDLLSAYARFLKNPSKTDNGCVAKSAICEALRKLNYDDDAFYVAGCHYHQLDPVFGPPVDSAAGLRVICADALLENSYPQVLRELADLLADGEPAARAGAIRALAASGRMEGALLLRYKVHVGDASPEVMGECFAGLLSLAADESIPFVVGQLDGQFGTTNAEVQLEAAIALGATRRPEVVKPLLDFAERQFEASRRSIACRALALVQHEVAIEYLLRQLGSEDQQIALSALDALDSVPDKNAIQPRITAAMERITNTNVLARHCQLRSRHIESK